MAYVYREPSSLSGQHYHLHHLHRHTQPQRPALLSPPMSDSSGSGSGGGSGIENEASQNKEQQQQLHTSAWRLKLRQLTITPTQAQTQLQHQSNGDMAHTTPNPNHIPENKNEGLNQNQVAHEKEWSTPAAIAHSMLKMFGLPSTNKGRSSSITTTTHITEELKKSLERAFAACEDDDPVEWTIQTLFEIGTRCAQQTKTMQLNEEDEKTISQLVIDMFHTYRNRWIWDDATSTEIENGIKDQNSNRGSSNMNDRACSIEHMRGDVDKKKKDNGDAGDLISLEESDEEKEKESMKDCKQVAAQKIGLESSQKKERLCPITQTHRQMLLDAILERKSALQVFLVIDTFGLIDSLSILPPMRGIKNNNTSFGIEYENFESKGNDDQNTNGNEQQKDNGADYGSLLIINLTQRGYFHAAVQTASRLRDLQHHRHLNHQQNEDRKKNEGENEKGKDNVILTSAQELLANRLLDKGHPDLIHLFVDSDRDLCRRVLQMIDSRFASQIWAWIEGKVVDSSLLDPFLVVQCRVQASSSAPASSLTAPSETYPLQTLFGMLEIANRLWMSFGFENTMKRFGSIQLIQQYCTVLSLLLTNSHNPYNHSYRQTPYKQKGHATHASENALNLTPWIFIPSVLPILKQNPALQRLVVWTFAMREDGVATAEFLASAFKLRAFFAQCVEHISEGDDDEQYRDEEKNDQAHRDGGTKTTTLLLEQPLTRAQGQSVDQNSNYNEGSPNGKEKCSSNYESERVVLYRENKDKDHEANYSSEFYKPAGPLLSASIVQMSLSDLTHNHYTNHSNTLLPLAVDLQHTYTRPTLSPFQTKPSSVPSSTRAFTKTSPLKQKKPLLIHRPHTTASTTTPKKQLFYSCHMQTLDYKPSSETTIILLNQMSQLQGLYDSLFYSDVVGMSLIRPLAKPWANFRHHPEKSQQMQLLQQRQQQLLHQEKLEREQQGAKRERGGSDDGGCAYLQLACSSDKRVYVIDLEVFLDKETDPFRRFPRLLGEIFFNPTICKLGKTTVRKNEIVIKLSLSLLLPVHAIVFSDASLILLLHFFLILAYNWKEEGAYLRTLFPTLKERQHHIDNLFDLYHIWITPSPNPNPSPQHPNPSNKKAKTWYSGDQPIFPTRTYQPKFKNVSSLLTRVMGQFLKRTSKLGWDAWMVKPLPVCLQQDLGM